MRKKRGMTLIELLVVIFVLVALAGFAIPQFRNLIDGTIGMSAKNAESKLNNALEQFFVGGGQYSYGVDSGSTLDEMEDAFTGSDAEEEITAFLTRLENGGPIGGGVTNTPNGVIVDTRLTTPVRLQGLQIVAWDDVRLRLGINGTASSPNFWLKWNESKFGRNFLIQFHFWSCWIFQHIVSHSKTGFSGVDEYFRRINSSPSKLIENRLVIRSVPI
jgi:prepilin-type N-terminal cleavage/methylation domain-containing protein